MVTTTATCLVSMQLVSTNILVLPSNSVLSSAGIASYIAIDISNLRLN